MRAFSAFVLTLLSLLGVAAAAVATGLAVDPGLDSSASHWAALAGYWVAALLVAAVLYRWAYPEAALGDVRRLGVHPAFGWWALAYLLFPILPLAILPWVAIFREASPTNRVRGKFFANPWFLTSVLTIGSVAVIIVAFGIRSWFDTTSVATQAQAEACLRSRGFAVQEDEEILAAVPAATGFFEASKNNAPVEVAYFRDITSTQHAREVLIYRVGTAASDLGVTVSDAQMRNLVRYRNTVLYWWLADNPTNVADIEGCLSGD